MMTPTAIHYGEAPSILNKREQTLKRAFDANPKRFKGKVPKPQTLPEAAWINKPAMENQESHEVGQH